MLALLAAAGGATGAGASCIARAGLARRDGDFRRPARRERRADPAPSRERRTDPLGAARPRLPSLGPRSASLKAGEYELASGLSIGDILAKLCRGEVRTVAVTLVEGLDVDETAQALAAAGLGDLGRLRAEFASPRRISDLDPAAGHLEGYLFPDTYRFARGAGEAEIADTLVATFRRQYETRVRRPALPRTTAGRCGNW